MEKILYISDLDGTLLMPDAAVSDYSEKKLNRFIECGGYFTAATARTPASVFKIISGIKISMPVIMMNGVLVYDTEARRYDVVNSISAETAHGIAEAFKSKGIESVMFEIAGNAMNSYYEKMESEYMAEYAEERRTRYGKVFKKITDLHKQSDKSEKIIYFAARAEKTKLDEVIPEIKKIKGIKTEYYRDVYREGVFYLEVFSDKASKKNGALYIKEKCNFSKLACFGDNLNDLSLYEACDIKYAVSNASPELKKKADEIIGSNAENGVAEKIMRLYPDIFNGREG